VMSMLIGIKWHVRYNNIKKKLSLRFHVLTAVNLLECNIIKSGG
jgi:hypothetical protein